MVNILSNPFLVLGVSADASMSDIKKVADRRLIELRLHGEQDSPQARAIERAVEELRDPLKRFQWGLFWLELNADEVAAYQQHEILSVLGERPRQHAVQAYKEICTTHSQVVKNHNLGSLALVSAVAATKHAQEDTPDDITDDLACVQLWEKVFQYIKPVIESDEFWLRQKMRAKSIDDPRLDSAYVERCRTEYLAEVIFPVGEVIQSALLAGHAEVASTYVNLLRDSDFDPVFVDQTLSGVYKPLADRVERHIEGLSSELGELDGSSDDVTGYEKLLKTFEDEVAVDLDVMLEVGDLPGYAEEHARDTSAEFLRKLSVAAWNNTSDPSVANTAIAYAMEYADASSLKSKLEHDLYQIREISSQNAAMKKIDPLLAQMKSLHDKEDFVGMLPIIDQIIAALPDDQKAEFRRIRVTTQANAAATLANRGIEYANAGRTNLALKLLKQALEFEHRPDQIALIKDAISRLSLGGTGFSTGSREADGCLANIGAHILVYGIIIVVILICAGVMGD